MKIKHYGSSEFAQLIKIEKTAENITSVFFDTEEKYCEVDDYSFSGREGSGIGIRFHKEIPYEAEDLSLDYKYTEFELYVDDVDYTVIIPLKYQYQILLIKNLWENVDKEQIPFEMEMNCEHL